MPVLPNSGPSWAEAALTGFDRGTKRRRAEDLFQQQIQDAQYTRGKQRLQDEAAGVHIMAPGEALPATVSQNIIDYAGQRGNAATPNDMLNSSLSFSPEGGKPTLSRAGAGAANAPGAPSSFRDKLAAMVGGSPDRGAQYQFTKGVGYTDRAPQWQQQDAARSAKMSDQFESTIAAQMVQQGERDRKVQSYVAAGVDPRRAALYVDNPALAENDERVGKPRAPQAPVMGSPEWLAAQTSLAKIRQQYAPADRVIVPTMGPDGPVYTPRAQAAGMAPVPGTGAQGGGMGGGMGSGGIGGLARTSGAITGMGVAHDQMAEYENSIKSGKASYDGLDHFKGQMATMFGADGTFDQARFSAALSDLNKNNPELANYLRAASTWALEDSQLSGKASDFRTHMDDFVSSIGPNQGPKQIDNIQRFRQTRFDELSKFQPAMQAMAGRITGGRGTPSASPPPNYSGAPSAKGPTGDINLGAHHIPTIDEMIRAGKSDAEIRAALAGRKP